MYNEFGKKPKFTLVTVIAVAAVMLVAATTEMAITGYAFAYNRNQATSAANDCGNGQVPTNIGCLNTDSQIQGDGNSVALAAQQTFPAAATGFTVTGSGTGITLTCPQGEFPGQPWTVEFDAQSDGITASGTYTISTGDVEQREGVFTFAETDGSTFLLFGVENIGLCSDPEGNLPMDVSVAISGDCGDDVAILYGDAWTSLTLRGNVECTLT
jgi:hypothetical protein